ncbi:hypothetical protein EYC84_007324 [Monilinia fructicola]|uniref:HNH nuclease domain-containing protein n=1 Tax=Monilinia fructicola TaxID=38448 RepID=A0A5M9JFE4_MONFR|nr:hypothetical protein EYC84_007324 [Monilinia fructicola]
MPLSLATLLYISLTGFIPLKDGMDLIVSEDDNGIDFIEFICKEEGYRAVETPSDSILPWDWPIDVIEDHNTVRLERGTEVILGGQYFVKQSATRPCSDTVIRIIFAKLPPILSGLHCITDTVSANYITWNKAYSLFPNSVLRHEPVWVSGRNVGYDQLMPAYRDKGWNLIMLNPLEYGQQGSKTNTLDGKQLYRPFVPNRARWIADKYSWVIKHPTLPPNLSKQNEIETPKVPDLATELNFFTMTTNFPHDSFASEGRPFYSIESEPYYTTSLKHCYGNTHRNDFAMETPSFWSYINSQLVSYSQKQERDKLSPEQKAELARHRAQEPAFYDDDHENPIEDLPDSWEFLDENGQIERLFKEWRKMRGLEVDDEVEEVKELQRDSSEREKPDGPICFQLWKN